MVELIMRLYLAGMLGDVRSPMPHLVGPPGCGKSTFVEQAAELLGVRLHVVNVSRISPLELEGVQMPVDNNTKLELLLSTLWANLRDGDIVLFDEFLRGFNEVFNGILDILTSRVVAGHHLKKVFFIGASNSVIAYDAALEDRLLHIPVPDPRKKLNEKKKIARVLCEQIGLLPAMADSYEMDTLLTEEVLPMYELLDSFTKKASVGAGSIRGTSVRNLIGQAQLRHVVCDPLKELISMNNVQALTQGKEQYVVVLDAKHLNPKYQAAARKLVGNTRLTPIQRVNLEINLQLVELESTRSEKEDPSDDDPFT